MKIQKRKLILASTAMLALFTPACDDDDTVGDGMNPTGDAAATGGTSGTADAAATGGTTGTGGTPSKGDAAVGGDAAVAGDAAVTGGTGGTVAAVKSSLGRLLVSDNNPENPRIVLFDLDDGKKLVEYPMLSATAVYASEPTSGYGWINQRNGGLVEIVASGISQEKGALSMTTPFILGERLVAKLPTHWVTHESWVVSFNDGDGSFDYVLETSLGTRRPLMSRANTGKAHHGVAVISHGNVFATIPNPDPAATSTLPIGVSRRFLATPETIVDKAETCPGLHGEASNEETVAFGCTDGVQIWERKNNTFTARHLPNPANTPMGQRVGTIRMKDGVPLLVGNWGNGFAIVPYRDATPTWIQVDIGSANRGFYIEPTGNRLIVLGADGTLRAYNSTTGVAIGAPLQVIEAWPAMGLPAGMPRAGLRLGDGVAYVADPRTGSVTEINTVTWQKGRSFNVGGWPSSVTPFGLVKAVN